MSLEPQPVLLDYHRTPWALAYMVRGALPVARQAGDLAPPITARWRGHRPDRRQLAAFLRVTGLPAGPALPLLYPHTFGFRLAMAVLTHPAFPVAIWRVLQIRNHLVQHRPIAADDRLDFETRVAAARVLEKGAEIDLRTTVHVGGRLAWEGLNTFLAPGRFGAPAPASPLARAPADVGPPVAEWRMADDAHWRFGRMTGDYNGIHAWTWYARRFGFRRALYHPPRVLGQCLARLPALDPAAPQRLDAWLKGPVPHGAAVRLHAHTAAPGDTTFALFADDPRPSIIGRLTHGEETMP
jgi:acyl dehydratase